MRGRPSRYTVQPPMSLTRPDVMRGPRFTSTGPRREPPPLTSFVSPCGRPAILCGAECRADVRWGEESSAWEIRWPPKSARRTTARWGLTRTDVMRGPRFTSTGPRAGAPVPHLIRFPVWARRKPREANLS
jgi:hypothetical protein